MAAWYWAFAQLRTLEGILFYYVGCGNEKRFSKPSFFKIMLKPNNLILRPVHAMFQLLPVFSKSTFVRMEILYIINVLLFVCVEGPFSFTIVLLVTVTTRYAVYRALTIKRVVRTFLISQLVNNCSHEFSKRFNFVVLWTSLKFFL